MASRTVVVYVLIALYVVATTQKLFSQCEEYLNSDYDTEDNFNISDYNITCEDLKENKQLFPDYLKCIEGQIYIRRAYWIGISNHNNTKLVVGFCKFCKSFYTSVTGRFIPLEDAQCLPGRNDQMCSRCVNDSKSPAINSRHYECIECKSRNIVEYFFFNIIGLGLLCFFIFIWDFFPGSGGLNPLVFFGQMTTTAIRLDSMGTIPVQYVFNNTSAENNFNNVLEFLYGVWNLDFMWPANSFCFSKNFDTMQVLTLNYFVASLPLIIVVILAFKVQFFGKFLSCLGRTFGGTFHYYITCSCLHKCLCLTRCFRFDKWRSIKTLVASCFLLSYTKFAMTTIYLITPMYLINSTGHHADKVLFYQGNLTYFGPDHTPYGILAIFFLLAFVLGFPALLLCLRYKPFKDQTSQRHESRWRETLCYLDEFLEACILKPFQRDLKWGKHRSEPCVGVKFWRFSFGLHDYRWYAGWYFILRFSLFAANLFSMDFVLQLQLNEILSMVALTVSLIAQPYKKRRHNLLDAFILILISVINMSIFFQYYRTYTDQTLSKGTLILQYILVFIPALLIAGQFFAKVIVNFHFEPKMEIFDELSVASSTTTTNYRRRLINRSHDSSSFSSLITRDVKFQNFYSRYLCNCERSPPQESEEEEEERREDITASELPRDEGNRAQRNVSYRGEDERRRRQNPNANTPLLNNSQNINI